MFKPKTDKTAENLDMEINRLLLEMYTMNRMKDAEYPAMVDQLVKLYELRNANAPKRMSADVKATIAANLAGIFLIIAHERTGVITTKALGFIQKLR